MCLRVTPQGAAGAQLTAQAHCAVPSIGSNRTQHLLLHVCSPAALRCCPVQDSGRSPDTSMFPATTEFAPAMPEAVPEPAASVEHMTYNSAYETYQETPVEAQVATPSRRASSPSPRCAEHHLDTTSEKFLPTRQAGSWASLCLRCLCRAPMLPVRCQLLQALRTDTAR
jgi:hypothetical protein